MGTGIKMRLLEVFKIKLDSEESSHKTLYSMEETMEDKLFLFESNVISSILPFECLRYHSELL